MRTNGAAQAKVVRRATQYCALSLVYLKSFVLRKTYSTETGFISPPSFTPSLPRLPIHSYKYSCDFMCAFFSVLFRHFETICWCTFVYFPWVYTLVCWSTGTSWIVLHLPFPQLFPQSNEDTFIKDNFRFFERFCVILASFLAKIQYGY
jgi:hypothetical protein